MYVIIAAGGTIAAMALARELGVQIPAETAVSLIAGIALVIASLRLLITWLGVWSVSSDS